MPSWRVVLASIGAGEENPPTEFKIENGELVTVFGKGQGWHGRALEKTVEIYEDFTLGWQMRWEQKSVRSLCHYHLDFGLGWVVGCVG